MEFTINRDIFLKSLGHANGIIERKTTLPILSNILIEAKESKIKITSTDLDIIYFEQITPQEIKKEGSTTTSASILYDILRKLEPNSNVELNLLSPNKLKLISGNSKFNLLCLPSDNFPLSEEDISDKTFKPYYRYFFDKLTCPDDFGLPSPIFAMLRYACNIYINNLCRGTNGFTYVITVCEKRND